MNKFDAALERVQNLYLLQTKLITSLDSDLRDEMLRKELRNDMRRFEELLGQVDWRFMGGIDVLESLRQLPGEVTLKLKGTKATAKKTVKQVVKMKKAKRAKSSKKAKKAKKSPRKNRRK